MATSSIPWCCLVPRRTVCLPACRSVPLLRFSTATFTPLTVKLVTRERMSDSNFLYKILSHRSSYHVIPQISGLEMRPLCPQVTPDRCKHLNVSPKLTAARSLSFRPISSQIRPFSPSPARNMKILAVLYSGGSAAREEPRLLGTVENEVSC